MKGFFMFLAVLIGVASSPYIGFAAKVVIDPGHGGSDPGAVGVNGLYEKTVNTDIASRLNTILLGKGYEVLMTRSSDVSVSLQQRVEMAMSANADLFVSIHANAHPSSSVRGAMVLYHDADYPNPTYPASPEMIELTPESRRLAQAVLTSMLEQVPNMNRGLVPSSAYVVRNGNIPSILVETAFLSNGQDAQMLDSPGIREKYATGVANGIMKFLPPTFSDIGRHWAYDSIIRLNEAGIVNGEHGKYYPDRPLTRAELVSIADRAFGLQKPRVSVANSNESVSVAEAVYGEGEDSAGADAPAFSDLPPEHWSYGIMLQAVEHGILRGYPDRSVRPDAPVTRAEAAVVLDRMLGTDIPGGYGFLNYADVTPGNWAFGSIMRLTDGGIVRGVDELLFGPDRYVTRAEIAAMVDRQAIAR